jgi:hypothetical protein
MIRASYQLASRLRRSCHSGEVTPDITEGNSGHNAEAPDIAGPSEDAEPTENPRLLAIAEPARQSERLKPEVMYGIIRDLCRGRELTLRQLAELLKRESGGLQRWTLRPMVQGGQLRLQFPDNPNHPKQAYRTNPDWREE